MRELRGRGRLAAAALAVVVVVVATVVAVAVTRHREPPAVPVATLPEPMATLPGDAAAPATEATSTPVAAPSGGVLGAAASRPAVTPVATPVPAASATARASRTVSVDQDSTSVVVRVGDVVSVQLQGTPTEPWEAPQTSTPQVLERLSGSATADGNATGSFRALSAGDGVILLQRQSQCTSGPNGGVCGVEARRISVTVTG